MGFRTRTIEPAHSQLMLFALMKDMAFDLSQTAIVRTQQTAVETILFLSSLGLHVSIA